MTRRASIEEATEHDAALVYGAEYRFPYALVILRGDDILGFGGFFRAPGGRVVVFSDLADGVFDYPVTLVRAAKRIRDAAVDTGLEVITMVGEREAAPRLLEHLGFSPGADGWYVMGGQ